MLVTNSLWKFGILGICFSIKLLNNGLRKSFGVLLLTLQSQFNTDVWVIGLVVSIAMSIGDFIGPVAGGIANKIGCRFTIIIGGFLLSAGVCFASLSQNVTHLAISLCILCGPGFGFTTDTPIAVLGHYFNEGFSFANGFAMAGASVGMMILGPFTQYVVELYGWRGAVLVIGGVIGHICLFGALIPPCKLSRNTKGSDMDSKKNCLKNFRLSIIKSMDISLFKEPMFIIIVLTITTVRYTQVGWMIYLVPNVVSKGVSLLQASFISTTAGIGNLAGRILPGFLTCISGHEMTSKTVLTAGMTMTTISMIIDAIVTSYAGMMTLVFFQGLGIGVVFSSINVVLRDEFGRERLVNSMGWVRGIGGIGRVIGGFMPGWIYHVTGSYQLSYTTLAAIQLSGVIVINVGRFCYSQQKAYSRLT